MASARRRGFAAKSTFGYLFPHPVPYGCRQIFEQRIRSRHGRWSCGLHDFKFLLGQRALFKQDAIGDANPSDIVQRGGFVKHVNAGNRKEVLVLVVPLDMIGRLPGISPGAHDMAPGFRVPVFCRLRTLSAEGGVVVLDRFNYEGVGQSAAFGISGAGGGPCSQ